MISSLECIIQQESKVSPAILCLIHPIPLPEATTITSLFQNIPELFKTYSNTSACMYSFSTK